MQPHEIAAAIQQMSANSTVYRPYHNERCAMLVKPLIDRVLEEETSCFVVAERLGYSAGNLHTRLNSGMKWLIENGPDRERYKQARMFMSFTRRTDGVTINYSKIGNAAKVLDALIKQAPANDNWMNTFMSWTERAKELDIFDSYEMFNGAIVLTEDDRNSLVRTCAQLGMELELKNDRFRVMR